MDIKNFTECVRVGEFPACADIIPIPQYHSSDGIVACFYTLQYPLDDHPVRLLLIEDQNQPAIKRMFVLRWDHQLEKIPDDLKNGKVLYDSANETTATEAGKE